MTLEARDATENVTGPLSVAGRNAANIVLRAKADWFFTRAALAPISRGGVFHNLKGSAENYRLQVRNGWAHEEFDKTQIA